MLLRYDSAVTPLFPSTDIPQTAVPLPNSKGSSCHHPLANYPTKKNCKLQIANSIFSLLYSECINIYNIYIILLIILL